MTFTFRTLTPKDINVIYGWLAEPHVMEFWDNGRDHKDDILNFAGGRKTPSTYFGGMFTYWIGFKDNMPFAFIMTHEENEDTEPPAYMQPYLSKTGKTIGLDFCIGNPDYLGKGLAGPTLEAFTTFFSTEIEPKADTYLIDPYIDNPRAIHVYEKAGFEIQTEFVQEGGYFDGQKGFLLIKKAFRIT